MRVKNTVTSNLPNNDCSNLPGALVIEETVRTLLIFFRYRLGLLVTLKPSLVLLVEAPALVFQRPSCQVLLVASLLIVEDVKERVGIDPRVEPGVVEYRQRLLREPGLRVELDVRLVTPGWLGVQGTGLARLRGRLHPLRRRCV